MDYSEKNDLLSLGIKYKGVHFDPNDSDNELFLEMLNEPTTEVVDQEIDTEEGNFNNYIYLSFSWVEEE